MNPDSPQRRFRCPCCLYLTLTRRHDYEICEVCFWEDDGTEDPAWELERSGPNHGLTLAEGQANYARLNACSLQIRIHVRPPTIDEATERHALVERLGLTIARPTPETEPPA